jgi:hypothetical protein
VDWEAVYKRNSVERIKRDRQVVALRAALAAAGRAAA